MRRLLIPSLAIMLFVPVRSSQAEEPLVNKVRVSLERGIEYLKGEQKDRGAGKWNWEDDALTLLQPGGASSLAMLALVTAGVPADDLVIKKGLVYLRSLKPQHTYVVGLQTMLFAEIGDRQDLFQIQANVDWLLDAAVTNGKKLRDGGKLSGWSYSSGTGNKADNSNTQYALLGLWAGRQAGATMEKAAWESIHEFYKSSQCDARLNPRGQEIAGWNYTNGIKSPKSPTLTMTAAGVSGLLIAALEVNDNKQKLNEQTGIAAKCGLYPDDDAIAKGMRWLSEEFRFNDPTQTHAFYNVYGIERVGRLSGQRFIGDHDWYREGCEILTGVKTIPGNPGLAQKPGGEWRNGKSIDSLPVISTSFSLLFLAKGRTPILLSKLAWDSGADRPGTATGWNRKHHDARHLVEYSSRELFKKMPLAWQIFDPRLADLSTDAKFNEELSNLLQSPVLYMNGHEAPVLTQAQKRLLRRYVDEGGFILAEACCGSEEFTLGFKKLMEDKEVFGQDSPLLPLLPSHPIWSSHALVPASVFQGEQVPEEKKILSIERGCKTVVVFSPQPLAGYWEESRFSPKVGENVGDAARGKLAYRLAGNIIAYATGLEPPKPRLDRPKVLDPKDDKAATIARYQIELAQVRHDGGDWQPAKNAMRALALNARDKYLVDVSLVKKEVAMTKSQLWQFKFLYMHGKGTFTTEEKELENMKAHLELGGTLLADACCGAEAFDKAFREFAKKLYPDKKLEVIPADDFFYSAKLNGAEISKLRCRTAKADGSPESTFKDVTPMLEGIQIDGRWAVIYSRYDIGCALEKNKSSACKGYDPDSAMKLATAALLYSLKR